MKSYFGYVRVSTKRQGDGASLPQQKTAISDYAAKHQFAVVDWFVEKKTAAKQGRPQFAEMMEGLSAGRAAGVIIHKIDRSARHLADWVWVGELIDRGIDVRFAHENLDLTTRGGRLTGDMLAVIAADFIRNNRDEVLKGFYGRLNQGLYPLGAPLGYLNCGGGKPKVIDPEKAPLIRQMFDLYATGRYSIWTLRAEMKKRGLRSRVGKVLSADATSRILHNPFYVGIIKIDRQGGETFQGVHAPLIQKRVFERVQSILLGRFPKQINTHDFVFRRRIACVKCGRSLYGELQKGHTYYRCHGRECPGTSFRETEVWDRVCELLALIGFDEEELRDLGDIGDEARANDSAAEQARITNVNRQLGLCDERLTRLTDALLDGDIDKAAFEDRKSKLLHERRELHDALADVDGPHQSALLVEKLELGNMAYLGLYFALPCEQRDTLELTVSNLSAEGKELAVALRFPFDRIAEARKSKLGPPDCGTARNGTNNCEPRKAAYLPSRFTHAELKTLFYQLTGEMKLKV